MSRSEYVQEAWITTLTGILVALVVAALGLALLYWTSLPTFLPNHAGLNSLLREVGALLIVAVALAFLWDLFGRRVFVNELFAIAGIARDLQHAGLRRVVKSPNEIAWKPLLDCATEIDLFFTYARSWRGQFYHELQLFSNRKNGVMRVVLPDPDDAELVQSLSRRFKKDPAKQRADIQEAYKFFAELIASSRGKTVRIDVWYTREEPVLSIYRFDGVAILAVYPHNTKTEVPHFICAEPGTIFSFARDQLNLLASPSGSVSRLVATTHPPDEKRGTPEGDRVGNHASFEAIADIRAKS